VKQLIIILFLILSSCGGGKQVSTLPTEKTDECAFSEEVCREAEAFQQEFDSHTPEEQKELVTVLNSYIEHCNTARKACSKSMR